ncbi:MAG TPA: peptidoglycan-associated lipoprotein Pal [Thermoanaerobaculia bacterium]|jgi:peptidoglycan-associated lipoprotein|nr:peptidoglycan-associated lipoprotein Pal [Thermoanaerobaculia bacterium]
MIHKRLIWVVAPLLLTMLYGCPKKKPASKPSDLNVETTTVAPPSTPTTEVQPPRDQTRQDQTEDPLLSQDMQIVNDELRRRGFSPDVYFAFDDYSLDDDARGKLARNADLLKSQARLNMTIEGHCDERGTSEYNLALGERRANSVKGYLASLGVASERMRTLSYGSERPVCTEHEETCWSRNRHAHMIITGRANQG